MSKSLQKKKMGRPPKAGGASAVVPVRISPDVLTRLDAYAERTDVTRSEAVRQLIEAGLNVSGKSRMVELGLEKPAKAKK